MCIYLYIHTWNVGKYDGEWYNPDVRGAGTSVIQEKQGIYVGSLGVVGTHTHIYIHMLGTLTFTLTLIHAPKFTLTFYTCTYTHWQSVCLCVVCLCVCVSERRHSDCSSVHLPVKLSVCPSVCLGCFFPSVCRFVCLSFHESFYLYFLFYLHFELLVCQCVCFIASVNIGGMSVFIPGYFLILLEHVKSKDIYRQHIGD